MNDMADDLERVLVRDLEVLGDRFRDEQLAADLYRALSNSDWRRHGGPDGRLTLAGERAREIVDGLREEHGEVAIPLAQDGSGVSDQVQALLEPLGWEWRERQPTV
jgi:hypothetical protein